MTIVKIIESSFIFKLINRIETFIYLIYGNSFFRVLTKKSWHCLIRCFKNSFLRIINRHGPHLDRTIIHKSTFMSNITTIFRNLSDKTILYSNSSMLNNLVREFKEEMETSGLKTIGIITTTTTLANIYFCFLLDKNIGLFGWAIRILFLAGGISCMVVKNSFNQAKSNSYFLRIFTK